MKHITILLLFITTFTFAQKPTLATSVGLNYVQEDIKLDDGEKKDWRQAFIQISGQIYLTEDLHQIEVFGRIQRGYFEGFRLGVKAHLNALPILTTEKYNIRTLIGSGLVYDSFMDTMDYPVEAKLSMRLHRALIEAGVTAFLMETQLYGVVPEYFVSVGWIF